MSGPFRPSDVLLYWRRQELYCCPSEAPTVYLSSIGTPRRSPASDAPVASDDPISLIEEAHNERDDSFEDERRKMQRVEKERCGLDHAKE